MTDWQPIETALRDERFEYAIADASSNLRFATMGGSIDLQSYKEALENMFAALGRAGIRVTVCFPPAAEEKAA